MTLEDPWTSTLTCFPSASLKLKVTYFKSHTFAGNILPELEGSLDYWARDMKKMFYAPTLLRFHFIGLFVRRSTRAKDGENICSREPRVTN